MPDALLDETLRSVQANFAAMVADLDAGATLVEHRADEVLPIASIGKVLALVELAERLVAGSADPSQVVRRAQADLVADSGLWQHLTVDELPLGDVAVLVGSVSDNVATNALLRHLGLEAVRERSLALGLEHTRLHDRVRDERSPGDPPHLATGTARELVGLLGWLWSDSRVAPLGVGARVLGWLALGTDLSMVAAPLELDPLAHAGGDRGLRLWNKTGSDVGVRGDVGVVSGPAMTVAYVALATWQVSHEHDPTRDHVTRTMRDVGVVVRRLVSEPGGGVRGAGR